MDESGRRRGTEADWEEKPRSLMRQKQREDAGWTTARASFVDTGILRARLPTVSRTNGHGSID